MTELTLPFLRDRYPLPSHASHGSKDERGRVLVVAGSRTVPGGALLAATGALRAGAGKLQIATVDSIAVPLGIAIPEAMVAGHPEDAAGGFRPEAADAVAARAAQVDAVLVGPGFMDGPGVHAIVRALLATDVPLVIDAAAIGALSELATETRAHGRVVILPHTGEMAALRACGTDEVEADPAGCGRHAADTWGAVTLVKGAESLVFAPGAEPLHYPGGGVGLATSGSGDTLAGIVTGLLARGLDPLGATAWGVWAHGEAGRRLAGRVGRVGFLARELLDEVPALLNV